MSSKISSLTEKQRKIVIWLMVIVAVSSILPILIHVGVDQFGRKRTQNVKVDTVAKAETPTDIDEYFNTNETIHLAIVCGGYSSTRGLYVLLKSILFYRTDPIHVHLFVDNIADQILRELLGTWKVGSFQVSYYNLTRYEKHVTWMGNSHYSHRFGLMKLEVPSILAEDKNLDKVIVLDTDMVVLGNIRHAWEEFNKFPSSKRERPIFGMIENQSDWYLDGLERSWFNLLQYSLKDKFPALGRGFNSGTILVDLSQIRNGTNWRTIWREDAEKYLTTFKHTTLADQDIFNSVFVDRGWLVRKLPCSLNLQLNDHSKLDEVCTKRSAKIQIVHWNSPEKLDTTNPSAELFNNWYNTFRNWDAKLLETYKSHIQKKTDHRGLFMTFKDRVKEYCYSMRPNLTDNLRVYPYFMDFDFEAIADDVTFVTHLSIDRLQVLDDLANNWRGPISAAIYLPEQETSIFMSYIAKSEKLSGRKNIGYHLVFRDYGFNYPINRMRNVALNHTVTPYVFLCDIDLVPPSNLYDNIRRSIAKMKEEVSFGTMLNRALVVPAFETQEYKFEFPKDKKGLIQQLDQRKVSEFREQIWPEGHKQTNIEKWKTSSSNYEVDWARAYEPFIVVHRDVPRFDERFIGFGWNKVQHITHLAALNYKFIVLQDAFVIHKVHSPSYDITKYRDAKYYKVCINDMKKAFLEDLRAKHPKFMVEVYAKGIEHHEEEEHNVYRILEYTHGG